MDLHPDIRFQKLTIGAERAPLLVIDNFVADADALVAGAATKQLELSSRFYPGVRAKAPLSYQQLIGSRLRDVLSEFFDIKGTSVRFSMCHFSLVTTPAQNLQPLQRIPHVDSLGRNGLASIHYLFRANLGGTAFYRHRKTGFEFIDETRQEAYFRCLQNEIEGQDAPPAAYIDGDTPIFQQVLAQEGVFNRMLVYRRNSLHSGNITRDFVPDTNPLTGRLSINSFIDLG